MRIWGIYEHKWLPALVVFFLSMAEPAINIVSFDNYLLEALLITLIVYNFPSPFRYIYCCCLRPTGKLLA